MRAFQDFTNGFPHAVVSTTVEYVQVIQAFWDLAFQDYQHAFSTWEDT
jgi:hypothetical protein